MATITTPYETQEEALEGRIRSMGYFVGLVQKLGDNLTDVRETIAEMQAAGFPTEYSIMAPVENLERSATIQVEPRIKAFLEAYQALIQDAIVSNTPSESVDAEEGERDVETGT